jgi:signal transduction histidine kinase
LSLDSRGNKESEHIPELISTLEKIHRQLSNLLRSTPSTTTVAVRQLGFLGALRKTVEVDLHGAFDEVAWEIQPEAEREIAEIPALVTEVLFFAAREAVRNAARYGRQKDSGSQFCLSIGLKYQNGLAITIDDNGAGFAAGEPVIFHESALPEKAGKALRHGSPDIEYSPGKTNDGGSGQGLALHSTMMAVIGGILKVESATGQYTRVTIELPETAWQNWE